MKILVLGAGVIGVTTAYYLARQGHEVTVLEREAASARETSFGNAGQISYGYASPWAAPGVPLKALKWIFAQHPPLSIRPDGTWFQLQWLLAMWGNCTSARYAVNKERLVRLSEHSRHCLEQLRLETRIEYEGRDRGTLQVFRTQEQLDSIAADITVLREAGVDYELLSRQDLPRIEPALGATAYKLSGGLRLPQDETGDCNLFTTRLAARAEALGVRFVYGTNIEKIERTGDRITAVHCQHGPMTADTYVMALGAYSRLLLKNILKIPVYPLKGYSITVAITNEASAPVSTLLDETYKIAVTRFDQRIRVGGMAEVVGYDTTLNPKREKTLEMVLNDLFPGSYDSGNVSFWTGLRPKTPDSTPIIGATPIKNFFLNTGHGTLGWTMACGSAQLLADIISGRPTAIPCDDLSIERYR